MHLVLDGRSIHSHMGGIGRAAWDLALVMARQKCDHRITILQGPRAPAQFMIPGADIVRVPGAMIDERFEQLELPGLLESLRTDLYLNPTFSVPAVKTTPLQVSIIHDAVFEDHPEWVEPGLCRYLRRWSRFSAKEASHVITVSDHARSRIQDVYHVDGSRISRIYNGIREECFQPPAKGDLERVRLKYDLSAPFVLYLGSVEPKKGIEELLSAFGSLVKGGFPGSLAIAGGKSGPSFDLEGILWRHGVRHRVRLLGYIEEEDKKALLQASGVFVYPSLYEGFGLPPLEALALGVPTVVSSETSLPEVVGDAALVSNVKDPDLFARAIGQALGDDQLRERTKEVGPRRARHFSWERSAQEVLDLLESLRAA